MIEFLFYQIEESGKGWLNDVDQSENDLKELVCKSTVKNSLQRAPRILNFMNALNISIEYPLSPFNEG